MKGWFSRYLPTVLALSFDEYQRYKFVSELIAKLESQTILDVGGGAGVIRRFLKDKEIIVLDVKRGDVIGDGTKLPFQDGSFDGVISVDTLQYIPGDERGMFLSELIRAARNYIIITSPIAEPAMLKAEEECNKFYRKLYGEDYLWLRPGVSQGLPEFKQIAEYLNRHKYDVYDNGSLCLWVKMLKWHFLAGRSVILYPLSLITNALHNVILYRLTKHQTPSVRKVVLVRLEGG